MLANGNQKYIKSTTYHKWGLLKEFKKLSIIHFIYEQKKKIYSHLNIYKMHEAKSM